jgi:thioredoxin-related protein
MLRQLFFLLIFSSVITFSQDTRWYPFNDGLETATKENKKILMDVYTDWCAWCKRMDKDVYAQNEVKVLLNKFFVLVKLNAESNNEAAYNEQTMTETMLAQELGVDGYPSTIFFLPNGEVITAVPGYVAPDKFLLILKYIGENHYVTMDWEEFEAKETGEEE